MRPSLLRGNAIALALLALAILLAFGVGRFPVAPGDLARILWSGLSGQPSGLSEALRILEGVEGIGVARFAERDVVRHPLVARIVAADGFTIAPFGDRLPFSTRIPAAGFTGISNA